MTGSSFNAERLDLARRLRGVTKRSLVHSTGLSKRSMAGFFAGESEPKPDSVRRLAEALGLPERFFYNSPPEAIPPSVPSFRAQSAMTRRQRDQAIAAGELGICLSHWIDQRFNLPPVDIARHVDEDPEAASMAVRATWDMGFRPIRNMVHLLEAHGVRAFSLAEDVKQVDAYSFWSPSKKPFVFLNMSTSAERSRFDAAHELGHLVMHPQGGTQRSKHAEAQANRFASAFLMPAGSVLARVPRNPTLGQTIRAKAHWKVSAAALTYRLRQLELLSHVQYERLNIEISTLGYRRREPEPISRETSRALGQVFGHLRDRNISITRIANELAINPEDLTRLLRGLVLLPLPV